MSRYETADQANRWARIRELLTAQEAALLFNALEDKARQDRKASAQCAGIGNGRMQQVFHDQASLAEDMAGMVLE